MSEPTSVNPFKTAQNINQKNKDIVFGYLRECRQWLLPNQYYQISQMIGVTILLYAVSIEYRVVMSPGALCKKEKDLKSTVVAKIPIGEIVEVEEIDDQRCRISSPVSGWLSLTAKDGRIILQRSNVKSALMDTAIHAKRERQTKILILKSITMLNDATNELILEKADWNLRTAIEAYCIAKYKYPSNTETSVNCVNSDESNIKKERNAGMNNINLEKRTTKVLILKSITTLNETTVNRILEKSDWSLRRAVEAFYIAKYKTSEYLSQKEKSNKSSTSNGSNNDGKSSGKKSGWWKSWKTFTKDNA